MKNLNGMQVTVNPSKIQGNLLKTCKPILNSDNKTTDLIIQFCKQSNISSEVFVVFIS